MTIKQNAVHTIFERMRACGSSPAIACGEKLLTYDEFLNEVESWRSVLRQEKLGTGDIVAIYGDFLPGTAALTFALIVENAIIVPLTAAVEKEAVSFLEISGSRALFRFAPEGSWTLERLSPHAPDNELIVQFRQRHTPGLIVFTSGSSGKPKGILHDVERVMRKFVQPRKGWRTLLFLMMDHFGGFNTFLSSFAYGGMAICVDERSPEAVCRAISQWRANLLPTTPTFLNLLIASGSYRHADLSSVELITYGTEVMPAATLERSKIVFPRATLKQTYGLSELGVLRSKSESDDSLWVKIGGDGFEVRVKDNLLWIRSEANMVGYLNAPSPFDEEGWFCTGDQVEVRGEYMRIIGRKSEMINVGGQKVFPSEVENVIMTVGNIKEVTVYGARHSLMGQVVMARISLQTDEEDTAVKERIRKHCMANLAKYKVPIKFEIVNADELRNDRFKKIRVSTNSPT